jgi:ribulose-5-phosphate 4-epimerase/fuculose-1-phosphate aldolase
MAKTSLLKKGLVVWVFFCVVLAWSAPSVNGADKEMIEKLKEKVVTANRILDMENVARPLGHVSVRIPGTENFLITGSIAPGQATADDVVICDMNGKVLQGKYQRTYSEVVIHTGVYKKRSEFNSVVHSHSPYVMALSMTETPVVPASFEAIEVCTQPIALYKKVVYIDQPSLGEEIAGMLGPNKAVMLKGHGAVVVGKTIEEATIVAVKLEAAARLQLLASSAGKLVPFTEQEKKLLIDFIEGVNQKGGTINAYGRAWAYYENLFKR